MACRKMKRYRAKRAHRSRCSSKKRSTMRNNPWLNFVKQYYERSKGRKLNLKKAAKEWCALSTKEKQKYCYNALKTKKMHGIKRLCKKSMRSRSKRRKSSTRRSSSRRRRSRSRKCSRSRRRRSHSRRHSKSKRRSHSRNSSCRRRRSSSRRNRHSRSKIHRSSCKKRRHSSRRKSKACKIKRPRRCRSGEDRKENTEINQPDNQAPSKIEPKSNENSKNEKTKQAKKLDSKKKKPIQIKNPKGKKINSNICPRKEYRKEQNLNSRSENHNIITNEIINNIEKSDLNVDTTLT